MKSDVKKTPCVEVVLTKHHVGHFLAIVDLDEILGDFQEVFCRYTMNVLKRPWVLEAGQYGLEKGLIEQFPNGQQMIDDFYNSPRLLDLPTVPGSQEFFKTMKLLGFTTWAVTGRPGHKYQRVVPDTLKWLTRNGFEFDRVVFTRAKGAFIQMPIPYSKPTIITLEDSAEHSDQMSKYVDVGFLRNRHYNLRPPEQDPINTVRFDTFDEVEDHIIKYVTENEETQVHHYEL